jgi:hypothetical protein
MDRLADKLGRLVLNGTWQLEDRPLRPGSSGQAWLFGARVRSTDERVVVKIFKPARSLDFEREIGALKKLSTSMSARTAPFVGHGTVEHCGLQLQFIVMGFVEGLPLDELLAADLFDLDERLEILVQIAEGLSELHQLRIIHRDLKPANVIVRLVDTDASRPAKSLEVKLVDFGISTVLERREDSHLTTFKGTPLYMAPEQVLGRAEVCLATDLYAFGLLARDLLRGDRRGEPIAPEQAVREIAAALDRGEYARRRSLSELFRACLAERPAERLSSGVELVEKLRAAVIEPESSPVYPRSRAIRRFRRAVSERGTPVDGRGSLKLLTAWSAQFCSSVLLACLSDGGRREAHRRVLAGEPMSGLVDELWAKESPVHPAAQAAQAFRSLRVTEQGALLGSGRRGSSTPDATVFPRTLLENTLDVIAQGTDDDCRWWTQVLLSAVRAEPLFQEFTLARLGSAKDPACLIVRHGDEREHPWQGLVGDTLSVEEPLLVKVNGLGRPDLRVSPVRLGPFAMLGEDSADLLFAVASSEHAPAFASPFSPEAVAAPAAWPFTIEKRATDENKRISSAPARPFSALLTCQTRPLMELIGPDRIYLLTEAGEWLVIGTRCEEHPRLRQLPACSAAALDPRGGLVVGTYEAMIARVRGIEWEYVSREAPVLSLTALSAGVLAGDAAGGIALFADRKGPLEIAAPEPITGLLAADAGGIAALGAGGSMWMSRWPGQPDAALEPVSTEPVGRPFCLFRCADRRTVGVSGATRAAVVDVETMEIKGVSPAFPDGIRDVLALPEPGGYAVLTDEGELWINDARFGGGHRVRFPRGAGPIAGARALSDGTVVAWTRTGLLFAVSRGRAVRRVADDGVCLAFGLPGSEADLITVRWRPGEGAQIQRVGWVGAEP